MIRGIIIIAFALSNVILGSFGLTIILPHAEQAKTENVKIRACLDLNVEEFTNSSGISVKTCAQPSFGAALYLNYSFVGYTDADGRIEFNVDDNATLLLHIVDREYGYGARQQFLNRTTIDSDIYLQSDYAEPLFTNVNGIDATVLFLPLNYNWSKFNVNFHYKNSTKKESIYQIRGIQMASSLVPNKFYDLTLDTFALNPAENEIFL